MAIAHYGDPILGWNIHLPPIFFNGGYRVLTHSHMFAWVVCGLGMIWACFCKVPACEFCSERAPLPSRCVPGLPKQELKHELKQELEQGTQSRSCSQRAGKIRTTRRSHFQSQHEGQKVGYGTSSGFPADVKSLQMLFLLQPPKCPKLVSPQVFWALARRSARRWEFTVC